MILMLAVLSAMTRAALILLLYSVVTQFRDILSWKERWGCGGMGGSGFMTIAVIMDVEKQGTPYDTWAGFVFSISAILFFWGFAERKRGHERRNASAVAQAKTHLAGRGA